MALSNAERQQRYRDRRRAEQPQQPSPVTKTVVPCVTTDPVTSDGPVQPRFLKARGRRLWAELISAGPGPAEIVLIEEACRLVDRLDRLDAILGGRDRAWLVLEVSDDSAEVTVTVDKVLSEARQQQIALKQILSELRQAGGKPAANPQPSKGGSGVADLTARIAARRQNAAS